MLSVTGDRTLTTRKSDRRITSNGTGESSTTQVCIVVRGNDLLVCSDMPGCHEQLVVEEACNSHPFQTDVVFRRVEAGISHVPDTAMNDDVLLPPRQPGMWAKVYPILGWECGLCKTERRITPINAICEGKPIEYIVWCATPTGM